MSLCLNMIVKNESKNIIRLLNSIYKLLDCYCICDTGSTDTTMELITTFFNEKNISGKIIQEPFKNFEYNRTFAIKQCLGMSDYILLMDADMVLKIGSFDKASLKEYDYFFLYQGNDDFYYTNARIVKNVDTLSYAGVTHEYLNTPSGFKSHTIPKDNLFIMDIGDGGCKANKFERDIQLLTKGIEDEPNNMRYYFYLANSYFDAGHKDKSIPYYKKRIELGGWYQEVWYSHYRLGLAYESAQPELAIFHWLQCTQIMPNRLENIYEIIKYYRLHSKQQIAYSFYKMVQDKLPTSMKEKDTYLFLKNDIYSYKIEYEFSIIASYIGMHKINNTIVQIFNHSNDGSICRNILSNMKFYKERLIPEKVIDISNKMEYNNIQFTSSSTSMIPFNHGYKLNIRYVNYNIETNGSYKNCDQHIITLNKCVIMDLDFKTIEEKMMPTLFDNRRYMGIEDVKMFEDKFIGTGYHANNKLGMCYGTYDDFSYHELKSGFTNHDCEKNWCLYSDGIVYQWYPLTLCKLNDLVLEKVSEKPMPKFFRYIRGSTNGFSYKDEIWFVTHMVSYETPRHYYHVIVVLDADMNLVRYSYPFKFEGEPIEYCLGIVVEDENVILTYSTWDRTSKIAIYNKNYIFSKVNIYENIRV